MTDFLFQIVLSNVFLSLALAIVALVVGVTIKRPHLAQLLWLLVLVELVTPPVVTIPVETIPMFAIPEQFDKTVVSREEYSPPNPNISGNEGDVYHSAETWIMVLDNRKKDCYSSGCWKCVCPYFIAGQGLSQFNRFPPFLGNINYEATTLFANCQGNIFYEAIRSLSRVQERKVRKVYLNFFSEVKKSFDEQASHEKKWQHIGKLSEQRMQEINKLLTLRQKQTYNSFMLEQRLKYQALKKVMNDAFAKVLDKKNQIY